MDSAAGSCASVQFAVSSCWCSVRHCSTSRIAVVGSVLDRRTVVNADQRFVFDVDGVEVRRVVIDEVHVDHDPVELAQPRHAHNVGRSLWSLGLSRIRELDQVGFDRVRSRR